MLRDDLKVDGIENIWVDTQDLLIGVIYNPPNRSQREFLDAFEHVLHSIFVFSPTHGQRHLFICLSTRTKCSSRGF